ncbi:MAG: hypothetical protein LCH30_02595 [Proteobacteria bacterium]|nr:hypothetical protein [Pseudomonadota bacterium]
MDIFVFSDFDGTMTDLEGFSATKLDFYKSLKRKFGEADHLWVERMVESFKTEFGEFSEKAYKKGENSKLLINRDALATFKLLIQKEEVKIFIITRNVKCYVEALLQYQGFTNEELAKITIIASGDKYQTVKVQLEKPQTKPSKSFIFEDNQNDANAMKKAVSELSIDVEVHVKKPGNFEWDSYLKNIEQALKPSQNNGSPPTSFDSTITMLEKLKIGAKEPKESANAIPTIYGSLVAKPTSDKGSTSTSGLDIKLNDNEVHNGFDQS